MEIDNLWKAEQLGAGEADGALQARRREVLSSRWPTITTTSTPTTRSTTPGTRSTSARRRTSSAPGPRSRAPNGLRFGVSNHSAHAWHWFQAAYGYDAEGPQAGVRYDAAHADEGRRQGQMVGRPRPAGTLHRAEHRHARRHHDHQGTRTRGTRRTIAKWNENAAADESGVHREVVPALPGPGRQVSARPALLRQHRTAARPGGTRHRRALLQRQHGAQQRQARGGRQRQRHEAGSHRRRGGGHRAGRRHRHPPAPVADRHLHRRRGTTAAPLLEQNRYKTVGQVVRDAARHREQERQPAAQRSRPRRRHDRRGRGRVPRRHGGVDERRTAKASSARRPWKVYGEGPSTVEQPEAGQFGGARDVRSKPYTIEDIRFTTKGDALYVYLLAPQPTTQAIIKSLATNSPHTGGRKVKDVTILGGGRLEWSQGEQGLSVKLPERLTSNEAVGLRIIGVL